MIISQIVAFDSKRGMGINNDLPWHLPLDLKWFKEKTKGHHILMGRKTFESLGRPLPHRTNVVISSNKDLKIEGVEIFSTLEEGIDFCSKNNEEELFITGGANIFMQIMDKTDRFYLTQIDGVYNCDVFYPRVDLNQYALIFEEKHFKDEKHSNDFTFQIWDKI